MACARGSCFHKIGQGKKKTIITITVIGRLLVRTVAKNGHKMSPEHHMDTQHTAVHIKHKHNVAC